MNKSKAITNIIGVIESLINDEVITLEASGEVEILLDTLFPYDEIVQDLVSDLACYRPSGGEYLYNANEIRVKLQKIVCYFNREYFSLVE